MVFQVRILILLGTVLSATTAYRILSINVSPSRSHIIVQEALVQELARRGHHVTMVSPYPLQKPLENYRQITVPMPDWGKDAMQNLMKDQSQLAMIKNFPKMNWMALDAANNTINHPEVQRIIKEEKFDLLVVGLMADFLLGVANWLGTPTVVVHPNVAMEVVNSMVGNPSPIATVPNSMRGMPSPMSFTDRLKNSLIWILEGSFGWYMMKTSEQFYNSNFPRDQFPSYDEVRRNVSLVLVNQHFTKTSPRPYVQAMVEVGGLQIKQTPDPLPEDIQKWVDDAHDGFILFSLGTNLLSSTIPKEKLDALISTFSKIKQRVIWKWDTEDMPNKPANVLLRKWLPQNDILAHKNCRLFVTHGGLGGVAEAQFHAVPLVGIPFFGDQQANVIKVDNEGWAITVHFSELTEASFSEAINEVLNNASYTETVKQLSDLYRDRPQSAMDTAVFWTEYVIRHKGARHMRYPGADLNFFQSHLLDVIAVLCVGVFVLVKVIIIVCRMMCGKRPKSKLKRY
ncbi:UDP-glucosyltransferase 2-like [Ochlerotatus camptorhynchus]|uniref:UDP-glucosyltransferase 2-like n=1 Tax=Ochlerotatus camptorhynchus TaxID=644619 RepID=UPI0031DD6B0B